LEARWEVLVDREKIAIFSGGVLEEKQSAGPNRCHQKLLQGERKWGLGVL